MSASGQQVALDRRLASGPQSRGNSQLPAGIERGLGAFLPPPQMQVGALAEVVFAIAYSPAGLARESNGRITTQARAVYVASRVKVTLQDHPAFEIQGRNGMILPLSLDDGRASWRWYVMPRQAGSYELVAYVEPIIRGADGRDVAAPGYTETVNVSVAVSPQSSEGAAPAASGSPEPRGFLAVAESWIKSLTGIVTALTALIAGFFGLRATVAKGKGKAAASKKGGTAS